MYTIDSVLGQTCARYIQLIDELDLARLTTQYPFESNDEYENILWNNPRKGMRIYWEEILSRSHLCSITGILRTRHWVSAVVSATRDKNLLSFAAAFRGLIESAADTSFSLRAVPLTLARLSSRIIDILSGKSDQLLIASELEGFLIHFAHARHLSGSEAKKHPPHHEARRTRDYIEILEQGNVANVVQCYCEMCDLTHPGQSSVWMWLKHKQNEVHLSAGQDESIISRYLKENTSTFIGLLMFGLNPSVLTLRILNYFPIPKLHTPQLNNWNFSSIEAWQKCRHELAHNLGRVKGSRYVM